MFAVVVAYQTTDARPHKASLPTEKRRFSRAPIFVGWLVILVQPPERRRRGGRLARGNRGSDLVQPSFAQRSQNFLPSPRFPIAYVEIFDGIVLPPPKLVHVQLEESIFYFYAHPRRGLHIFDRAHKLIA